MSLCEDGINARIKGGKITVMVEDTHPLIQLGNLIDWSHLAKLAQPDLERTKKGFWWLGRKLKLRIHLAVMILQILFKWTDRLTEIRIKTTPLYQVFCGVNILSHWRCPDHTKIEQFRNRLSPETHKAIADYIVKLAIGLGFGDPSKVDIDSTVQEANISYPSDATLMRKLAIKAFDLLEYLKGKKDKVAGALEINLKLITKKYQQYVFYGEECCSGEEEAGFQEISCFGEVRAGSIYSISFGTANRLCGEFSLELSGQSKFAHQRCLEIPFGRRAFCQDGNNQVREDSFPGDERCSLCSEGEGGERQGVWASFPAGKNRRKFFDSLSLHFTENERQRMPARYYHGTLCGIRREGTGVGDDRQGVLLPGKHKIRRGDDGQCRRSSTTGECKESGRGPPEREIIQQKSRSGTTHRTCKTIWIRKKQNEVRRGHLGIGIPFCDRIQSSSANEKARKGPLSC